MSSSPGLYTTCSHPAPTRCPGSTVGTSGTVKTAQTQCASMAPSWGTWLMPNPSSPRQRSFMSKYYTVWWGQPVCRSICNCCLSRVGEKAEGLWRKTPTVHLAKERSVPKGSVFPCQLFLNIVLHYKNELFLNALICNHHINTPSQSNKQKNKRLQEVIYFWTEVSDQRHTNHCKLAEPANTIPFLHPSLV